MRSSRSRAWALGGWLLASQATAAPCPTDTGLSSCIDADPLWIAPAPGRFVAIPSAIGRAKGELSVGLGGSHLSRPVVLIAPSPDPLGRKIEVVGEALNLTALLSYAPLDRVELALALPTTVHQRGTGLEGVTAQRPSELEPTAWRDPRLSAAYTLWARSRPAPYRLALASRLTLGLPLGQTDRLAGGRSAVVAPSVVLELSRGRVFAGSEIGARLRQPTEIGTARLGSQLVSSLGLGADLLDRRRLTLAVEAWLLPVLVEQGRGAPAGAALEDRTLVVAEWLASVGTRLLDGTLEARVGAGSALPWSSERLAGEPTEHFAGVTTPAWRLVALLRVRLDRAPGSIR